MKITLQNKLFVPAALADSKEVVTLTALLSVDTIYGRWPESVQGNAGIITISNQSIPYLNSSKEIPDWEALGIDLVVDCSGRSTTRAAALHLDRGANKFSSVLPKTLQDCDAVLLKGINLEDLHYLASS